MDLSVIVLSYNTKAITEQCLRALFDTLQHNTQIRSEIVIVDNASSDGSSAMIQELVNTLHHDKISWNFIQNSTNYGFSKGNNIGVAQARGDYVLFLNSDVIMHDVDFRELLDYLHEHRELGALTVKVMLDEHTLDPASHRGFPTVWNSFCYFSKLEYFLGHIPILDRVFGGYHMTHLDIHTAHIIDSPTGAFYLIKKPVLSRLKGFDEDFFMYGEDLDLSFRLKEAGYAIMYYPKYAVLHLKHRSGLDTKNTKVKKHTKRAFYDAMKIFYKKHYQHVYPSFVTALVLWFIDLKGRSAVA